MPYNRRDPSDIAVRLVPGKAAGEWEAAAARAVLEAGETGTWGASTRPADPASNNRRTGWVVLVGCHDGTPRTMPPRLFAALVRAGFAAAGVPPIIREGRDGNSPSSHPRPGVPG